MLKLTVHVETESVMPFAECADMLQEVVDELRELAGKGMGLEPVRELEVWADE